MSGDGIFAGLRVVDLTTGMAGPMVSMILADHGADVIKCEHPGGDWARELPAFSMWNRGKRSVRCDLHTAAGRELVRDLVVDADVVVDSGHGGVLERCGLDDATFSRTNPGLVICDISGLPDDSGHGARVYEGVVAAAVGRMAGLDRLSGGLPEKAYDRPAFTAAPVGSFGAAQLALQGVVAALLQRAVTGSGQRVATSLLHGSMAFLMRQELARGSSNGGAISAAAHRGIEMCFLTAECADGRFIQMCARQDRHFQNWLRAVGLEQVLDEPRYEQAPMGIPTVEDVVELEDRLREAMRQRSQAEWMRIFTEEFDVGADPFLTPAEFLDHPDMVDNGRVVELDDPVFGRVRQIGALVDMSRTPARIDRPAPALGDADESVAAGAAWAQPRLPLESGADGETAAPPLSGITILEVAYYIAGPMATTLLAELGARVIKVEPLAGDPYRRTGLQSAKFVHGKESIAIDLKQRQGADLLDQLIDRADVIVHSFRSGAAERLGLDADRVLQRNPGAVHLYASSYGSRGPQSERAAFHSTPNALSGGGIKQAGRGNPPVNDSYADPGSALGAATAILLGLWARHVTGEGQSLETTMLTSTGYIHSSDLITVDGEMTHLIADRDQFGLCPGYRLYPTADGWVFVAAVTDAERSELERVTGVALDEPDVAERLEQLLRQRSTAAWLDELAGVRVAEAAEIPFDEWLVKHDLLIEASHALFGDYWRIPPKLSMSGSSPVLRPACAPGEQTVAILTELGCSPATIERLRSDMIVADGSPV